MDGYQFSAAIFQSLVSLAWPAALVASVWLFREKLTALLPFLRMKYKDLDISFRLDQAEKEAAALPPPSPNDEPQPEPTPEEKDRIEKLAEISPRAAILEMRRELEETLTSVAQPFVKQAIKAPITMLTATRALRSSGVIDAPTSGLLDDLRSIGNEAAHRSETEFTKEDALRFRDLANQAIRQLTWAEIEHIAR